MAFDLSPKHREFLIIALLVAAILLLAYIIYKTHKGSEGFKVDCTDCAKLFSSHRACDRFKGMSYGACQPEELKPILEAIPRYQEYCAGYGANCADVEDAQPEASDAQSN